MKKKLLTGLMLVISLFFMAISVAKVYADYAGPANRTTTTDSCDKIVRNYDDAYICSFPQGGSNYDHCGDHCGDDSNVDCASVYCDAIRNNDPSYRVESQSTTTTLPNATAGGSFHCNTPGDNGWCRGGASLVFTANEPVDGYKISAIETDLWGYVCQPNTASPTCTYTNLSDGTGTVTFWAESTWGDSSTQHTLSWKIDTTPPMLSVSVPSPDGANGWFVSSPVSVNASGSDETSGLASLQCRVDGGAWQDPPVTVDGDGTHSVECQAVDNAGNITSWSDTVKVDTTAPAANPTTNGTMGNNGWYISQPTVSANASDATSGVAQVQYQVDGGAWQSGGSVTLDDGTHSVKFRVTDNAGNTFTTAPQTVKVDTTAPVLTPSVPAPDGQNGWFVTNPDIDASGSDETSGLASLQCRIDGGAWQDPPVTVDGDGTHSVECQAVDNAGNITSWSDTVKVDTTAPVLTPSVPAPDGENGWFVTNPDIDASGSDETSGLALVQCRVDSGAWQDPPVTVDGDGSHTVDCQAVDNAGNTATWSDTVKVDTTAPAANPTTNGTMGNNGWYISQPTVSANASDATSGVAQVQYQVDGGAWQSGGSVTLDDGTHSVQFRVTDNAGNTFTTAPQTVKVDTTAPVSAFTSPHEGDTVWGIVTLQGQSDDLTSGVAEVEVSTDNGVTWQPATRNASAFQVEWDTRPLPDGDYTLLARARDNAGNEEHTAVLHVTVDNAPPKISLHPHRWYSWQTAQADIQPNPYIPLQSVTVSVIGPRGYIRTWEYGAVQHIAIHWNTRWYSDDGEWARPGEYPVVVKAVDIYGHTGQVSGTVVVQAPADTPTPTPAATFAPTPGATKPLVSVTPTLTATPTPRPSVPTPTRASVLLPPAPPTAAPVAHKVKHGGNRLAKSFSVGVIGGILILLSGALIADPRPKPTRGLASTLRAITRYLETKKEE